MNILEAHGLLCIYRSNEEANLTLTPSEPYFVQYNFPPNVDVVLIQATSEDSKCAVLSLQDIQVCRKLLNSKNIFLTKLKFKYSVQFTIWIEILNFPGIIKLCPVKLE